MSSVATCSKTPWILVIVLALLFIIVLGLMIYFLVKPKCPKPTTTTCPSGQTCQATSNTPVNPTPVPTVTCGPTVYVPISNSDGLNFSGATFPNLGVDTNATPASCEAKCNGQPNCGGFSIDVITTVITRIPLIITPLLAILPSINDKRCYRPRRQPVKTTVIGVIALMIRTIID